MRRLLIALTATAVLLGLTPEASRSVEAAPTAPVVTEIVYLSLSGLT